MRGSLREKIGEGASADVHSWAPGQVVKLFKSGVPRRLSWHEAQMTHAVFAAGRRCVIDALKGLVCDTSTVSHAEFSAWGILMRCPQSPHL